MSKICLAAALLLAANMTACSTAPSVKPIAAPIAAGDRFVPINFALDAGAYITMQDAVVAQHLSDAVSNSGRFVRVERKLATWPQTILMTYRWEPSKSAGELAGVLASAATLMIIPAPLTEQHTIKVEILERGIPVKEFNYTEEVKTSLSLFNDPVKDRKLGVERLLDRFYVDLAETRIIPRANDVFAKGKEQKSF